MRRLLFSTLFMISVSLLFALRIDLSIIHTSDLHGNIFPVDYATGTYSDVGLAKISTFLNQVRTNNPNVIVIDTGDLIQGTPFAYYYARIDNSGVNPMISALNYMGFTASVVGNHEFNYGPAILADAVTAANFPILSANIVFEGTEEPAFDPYIIVDIPVDNQSIKIGIIGLTTSFIPNWEEPSNIAGLDFLDPVTVARKYVQMLRGSVDVIILAYHGGFERDLETGLPTEELVRENVGYEILKEVDGVDVLLSGHQHRLIAKVVDGVVISQPSNWGKMVGRIDLSLERSPEGWMLVDRKVELVSMKDYAADEDVLQLFGEFGNRVQRWLNKPVGFAIGEFYIDDPFLARLSDNTLMEFINRIQMEVTGAPISSAAIFMNDIKGWKTGPITVRDINAVYIYPNTLKVLKVKGSDIKAALEKSAEYFTFQEEEVKVNRDWIDPKPRHYNYDMWEGIQYIIAVDRPVGDRVLSMRHMDQPVIMDAEYEIVLNNYRAGGGGGYTMFRGKPVVREVMLEMAEIITNYVMERGSFSATLDQNWSVGTGSVHVVGWNETIRTIAQMYEMEPSEIMKYNPDLKGLLKIPPGTRLIIYKPFLSEVPVM